MDILRIQRDVRTIEPDVLVQFFGIPLTNTFMLSLFIVGFLVFVAFFAVRRFTLVPGKVQNGIEVMYESMVGLVEQIAGTKELAIRIFPLIGALFVYIGIANLIGLIPGLTSFTYNDTAIFRTPTSDFNTTFGLALAMVVLIQLASIREWGVVGYIGRFIKVKEVFQGFRKGMKDGIMAIVQLFIGFLDIISEAAKVISLSFRLFGNMFAGEVLAILVLGAFAYLLPSLWLSLNLLFALVQAVVFGTLVAAYYTLAMKPQEEKIQGEKNKKDKGF
jgi:F-type H+-transporting ATPase subunit a